MTNIAIITGASSGLGLEFAKQIDALKEVDEIWLVARNEEKLNVVAKELSTPAVPVPADLSKPADISTIAEKLAEDKLNVSYLVNSAGFGRFGSWKDIKDTDAETMIDLDCKGVVMMTRACLPYMSKGSQIIQIASAAGFAPLPYMNVYAASKAFVLRYTRGLDFELRDTGISAMALCPTWVKTGFESQARKSKDSHAVNHLLFAQDASTVVERALRASKKHVAICCASLPSYGLRIAGKVFPDCIIMACWNKIRKM